MKEGGLSTRIWKRVDKKEQYIYKEHRTGRSTWMFHKYHTQSPLDTKPSHKASLFQHMQTFIRRFSFFSYSFKFCLKSSELISVELRSSEQKLEAFLRSFALDFTTSPALEVSISDRSYDSK